MRLRLLARDISIATETPTHSSIQNHIAAHIVAIEATGHPAQRLVRLDHPCGQLLARITHRASEGLGLHEGQRVWAQVKSVAVLS